MDSAGVGLPVVKHNRANLHPCGSEGGNGFGCFDALHWGRIDNDIGGLSGISCQPDGCADSIKVESGRAAGDQNHVGLVGSVCGYSVSMGCSIEQNDMGLVLSSLSQKRRKAGGLGWNNGGDWLASVV